MDMEYQDIRKLYEQAALSAAEDPESWQRFLSSACKNYKCRFDEQILIYAQNPDATAVARMEVWNRTYKRWVKKDAKGIAVFDPDNRDTGLSIYFDITDTLERARGSRHVPIWQMQERFEYDIRESLSNSFGEITGISFGSVLMQTAENAVEDHITDYYEELKANLSGSFLEDMDALNVGVEYRTLVENSVAFMLMQRCGIDAGEYFDRDDFAALFDFNTVDTINAVGTAASDISEIVLKEISQTIKNMQKEPFRTFASGAGKQYHGENRERRKSNERDHIPQRRRLSYTKPDIAHAGNPAWQIRIDAQTSSEGKQEGDIHEPADEGRTERLPSESGTAGTIEAGDNYEADGRSRGRDGENEVGRFDEVGWDDEQLSEHGGGADHKGTDLQLEAEPELENGNFLTEAEQEEIVNEAEEQKTSAFSFSQEEIDAVLTGGSRKWGGKYRIYEHFTESDDAKANIAFLKKEYGTGGRSYTYLSGDDGFIDYDGKGITFRRYKDQGEDRLVFRWDKAEKRIRELVKQDRYLNEKDKEAYPAYQSQQEEIQKRNEKRNFVHETGELSLPEKKDSLPTRLAYYIETLALYEQNFLNDAGIGILRNADKETMEKALQQPETVQQLLKFLYLVRMKTSDT